MKITDYQSKDLAYELTKLCASDNVENLAAAVAGTQVDLNRLIKEAHRAAATSLTLEGKLASQRQIKAIEAQRNDKRRSLLEAQDAIDQQREDLIGKIGESFSRGPQNKLCSASAGDCSDSRSLIVRHVHP